jgi:hypothetical protein
MSPETITSINEIVRLFGTEMTGPEIAKKFKLTLPQVHHLVAVLRVLGEPIPRKPMGRRPKAKVTVTVPRQTYDEFQAFLAWKAKQSVRPVSISANGRHA